MNSDTEKSKKRKKKSQKNKSKKVRKKSSSRSPTRDTNKEHADSKDKNIAEPNPTKVSVMHLSDNVKKGHLMEIFEQFGTIVDITMVPPSKAVISFEMKATAKKATKIMNGGMIDNQEIRCVLLT